MISTFIPCTWSLVAYNVCFLFYIYINKNCTTTTTFPPTYISSTFISILWIHFLILNLYITPPHTPHPYTIQHPTPNNSLPNFLHKHHSLPHMYKHLLPCPLKTLIYVKYINHLTIIKAYALAHTPIATWMILISTKYTLHLLTTTLSLIVHNSSFAKTTHTPYKQNLPNHPLTTQNTRLYNPNPHTHTPQTHTYSHRDSPNKHPIPHIHHPIKTLTLIISLIIIHNRYHTSPSPNTQLITPHLNPHKINQCQNQAQQHNHNSSITPTFHTHTHNTLFPTQHTSHSKYTHITPSIQIITYIGHSYDTVGS